MLGNITLAAPAAVWERRKCRRDVPDSVDWNGYGDAFSYPIVMLRRVREKKIRRGHHTP